MEGVSHGVDGYTEQKIFPRHHILFLPNYILSVDGSALKKQININLSPTYMKQIKNNINYKR